VAIAQELRGRRYPKRAVDHDAHRRWPLDQTHGQQRVVRQHGANTDEHGVVRGAELVREPQAGIAAHPPRIARPRRDAAVDRLRVMHGDALRACAGTGPRAVERLEEVTHAAMLGAEVWTADRLGMWKG